MSLLDCSSKVKKRMDKDNSEGGRKAKVGGEGNIFELIEKCIMCRSIRHWAQWMMPPGCRCTLNDQNLKVYAIEESPCCSRLDFYVNDL